MYLVLKQLSLIKFFKKTHCVHFKTRNTPCIDMKIGYNNKLIPNPLSFKFIELTIDGMLSWRILYTSSNNLINHCLLCNQLHQATYVS